MKVKVKDYIKTDYPQADEELEFEGEYGKHFLSIDEFELNNPSYVQKTKES